ncbi:MAG: 2-oxo-4-hydroxy-4-carboxy-5-ureidoimidazoline decarboxylase [Nocardioides sp.]
MPDVAWLDAANADDVRDLLLTLTASPAWAGAVVAGRPYGDVDALLDHSDALVGALPEGEVDAALSGHPRIGEGAPSLDADSAARSAREQAGMAVADDRVKEAMASANADYEARFGRIYLVAAAGRTAEELLALVEQRLSNDPATELDVVRRELARITRLRLADTFGGDHA